LYLELGASPFNSTKGDEAIHEAHDGEAMQKAQVCKCVVVVVVVVVCK
jgi:hypothetical protein